MADLLAASPIVRALGWALLQSLWQGALIGGVTALALLMLRNGPPNRRYVTACAGLLAMTLAFADTAARAVMDVQPPAPAAIAIATAPSPVPAPAAIPAAPGAIEPPSGGRVGVPRPRDLLTAWSIVAVPAWLIGVLLLSGRLAAGWLFVHRIRREAARPVPEIWRERVAALSSRLRVCRAVRVVESRLVAVPTVIGWLRPVILLPVSALSGLRCAQLEAILAHELAHIRRHDYLVNLSSRPPKCCCSTTRSRGGSRAASAPSASTAVTMPPPRRAGAAWCTRARSPILPRFATGARRRGSPPPMARCSSASAGWLPHRLPSGARLPRGLPPGSWRPRWPWRSRANLPAARPPGRSRQWPRARGRVQDREFPQQKAW